MELINRRKRCFVKFAQAISQGDFVKARKRIQKTWLSIYHNDKPQVIARLTDGVNWKKAVYVSERNTGKAAVDILFSVGKKTYTCRLICEVDAYKPGLAGSWGVNPDSIKPYEG